MTRDEIEAIVSSDEAYEAFVTKQDTHPNNAALELIGAAYELDGDELYDDALLDFIQAVIERNNYLLDVLKP